MSPTPRNRFERRLNVSPIMQACHDLRPKLVSRVRKSGCPVDQAEDVVQNLIEQVIRDYNPELNDSASAYVWTQLRWHTLRHHSNNGRDGKRFVSPSGDLELTDILEGQVAADRMIADMVTDSSVATSLYASVPVTDYPILDAIGNDWTTAELADALGVSLEAARARKSRLIKTLRQRFATEDILS